MKEIYISVDIEADGPIPGDYSMLSLGACVVGDLGDPLRGFYTTLKPISESFVPEALHVSGLYREELITSGSEPRVGMNLFAEWLREVCGSDQRPVFVAFNATFDWMFVHWYFMHFLGSNPFGISGWDIKAYYAGLMRIDTWSQTTKRKIEQRFLSDKPHTHNALDDAREQAEIFQKLRREAGHPI